tara:strand:+ start:1950 stop:2411 length:462 start_codon:yes stop_codon:yes gene_type:complete
MANQDPQPEIYNVQSNFAQTATAGVVTNIQTSQANNEEVRIYAMMVNITTTAGAAVSPTADPDIDFNVQITVGPNNIPTNPFSIAPTFCSESKMLTFPTPILVLYQYPLQVTITPNNAIASADGRTVTLQLISELALQKVAGTYTDSDFPRSR